MKCSKKLLPMKCAKRWIQGRFWTFLSCYKLFFRVADSNFTWWLNNVFRSFASNTCAAFATTAHRSKIKSTHTYHIILLASTTHTQTIMPLKLHFTVKILFFPTPFATLCKENKNVVTFLRDTHKGIGKSEFFRCQIYWPTTIPIHDAVIHLFFSPAFFH